MAERKFGKVTMSTLEYRELVNEAHKFELELEETKRRMYDYFSRAENAERQVKHLGSFIQSDEEVLKKFNEYESMHTVAKN